MPNIDIRLVGASNLRRTERLGRQDPYAVCQLGQQHFRTHVAKDCDTQANWQTVGQFTGVKPQDVFTITVYNRNRVSADEEIGALRLSVQDFMHGQLVDRQYQLTSSRGQPSGQIHLRVHMNSAGMPSQPAGAYGAGYQQSYGAAQPAMAPSGGYAPAMPAPMGHAPAPAMSAYPMGGSAPMGSMPPTYGTTPGMPAHTGYPGSAPMPMAGGAYPGAPGMATGYPATGAGYPAGGMPATGYAPGMPAAGMPAMPGTAPGSAGAPMAGAMAQGLGISGPSGASPYQHHQPYQRL